MDEDLWLTLAFFLVIALAIQGVNLGYGWRGIGGGIVGFGAGAVSGVLFSIGLYLAFKALGVVLDWVFSFELVRKAAFPAVVIGIPSIVGLLIWWLWGVR